MSTSQTTADVTAAGLSKVDQNINNTEEDRSHEARGHKANLSNPSMSPEGLRTERMYLEKQDARTYADGFADTSQASKEKSARILKELGEDGVFHGKQGKGE